MGIFTRKASGLLAAVAAASLAMLLCSCSVINEKLEEYGLDDLGDKLETVWNEVGIDTIRDMTDEAWREFGFGKSLDWPESGPGSKLPVLRSGRMDGSYSNGSSGFIVMAEITQEARSAYEDELVSLGFPAARTAARCPSAECSFCLYTTKAPKHSLFITARRRKS